MPSFFKTGDKEFTKEDLIKLGLDPDKVITDDKLKESETRITTSLTESIRASLSEMENRLKTPPRQEQRQEERQEQRQDNKEEQIDPVTFMEDPVKHSTDIANRVGAAVLNQQLKFAADSAWERGKETLPGFKNDALAAEIEEEWKKYPDHKTGNAASLLRNLHDMVMGRHQSEIMQDTAKKEGKFNLVQSGAGSGRQNIIEQMQKKPEDSLTQEELKAAASFGMTAVEYAGQKGSLKYV